jgi:hypothetical protein
MDLRTANAVVVLGFLAWPIPAWAYRPFDSTDADVVDKDVWEFEFSPLSYEHSDDGTALISPSLRTNYGIVERWELVAEGEVGNFTHGRSELSELQLDVKTVLREGTLQDKGGPSVASEFSILLPGISTQDGAGLEWAGIVSQRWDCGTLHFNFAAMLTREQRAGLFTGIVLEGPEDWLVRPVAELTYEREFGISDEYSALIGAIWPVSDHLSFDLGYRRAWIDSRPDEQVRAGVTFDM